MGWENERKRDLELVYKMKKKSRKYYEKKNVVWLIKMDIIKLCVFFFKVKDASALTNKFNTDQDIVQHPLFDLYFLLWPFFLSPTPLSFSLSPFFVPFFLLPSWFLRTFFIWQKCLWKERRGMIFVGCFSFYGIFYTFSGIP